MHLSNGIILLFLTNTSTFRNVSDAKRDLYGSLLNVSVHQEAEELPPPC